jgi:hypothetical protein
VSIPKYTKQPGDKLDYDIDFNEWLSSGDSLASVNVTADTGITIVNSTIVVSMVKVWLSGGNDGETYKITVKVTTDEGRIKEQEFRIKVKER